MNSRLANQIAVSLIVLLSQQISDKGRVRLQEHFLSLLLLRMLLMLKLLLLMILMMREIARGGSGTLRARSLIRVVVIQRMVVVTVLTSSGRSLVIVHVA